MSDSAITVTFLAMAREPSATRPYPQDDWPHGFYWRLYRQPPLGFYRALYDRVGRPWHWETRRALSDKALARLIHDPCTYIYVLWDGAHPAGFVEINYRGFPQAQIVFVGLAPEYIGRGLGGRMVRAALATIDHTRAKRVIIQTCSYDHPAALLLYQKLGFTVYNRKLLRAS